MNMNGNQLVTWLVVGLIPYHIKWQSMKDRRILEMQALFWSVVGHMQPGEGFVLTIHVALIKHLGNVAQAILAHLRREEEPRR